MLTESRLERGSRPVELGSLSYLTPLRSRQGQALRAEASIRNELLSTLQEDTLSQLRPLFGRVSLKRKQVLHERSVPIRYAYFIEEGAAAILSKAGEEGFVEVGTLGRGDFVGCPVVLGTLRSPHRCVVQVPGEALRIDADDLRRALEDHPSLRSLLLAYIQMTLVQSTQLAVCNTRHTLKERMARWLLAVHDGLDGDEIPITHQILSRAIGVRRAGITTALGDMEAAGLVRRGRSRLRILDRAALEHASCGCGRALRAERRRLFCQAEPDLLAPAEPIPSAA